MTIGRIERVSYRYQFAPSVLVEDIHGAWLLAALSCHALFGEARVLGEASHTLCAGERSLWVHATTSLGVMLNELFQRFLRREYDADSFTVTFIPPPHAKRR